MDVKKEELSKPPVEWKTNIEWITALYFLVLHIAGVYGIYLIICSRVCIATGVWALFIYALGGIGTGIGAHRFFSHKSFKAKRSLKIFLIFCQTLSGQFSVHYWVHTHRIHHKFPDTDRDPSNINRGFFFAWVGNYFMTRHPDCQREWDRVDLSDIEADKDLMFQKNNYVIIWALTTIGLSTLVPVYFWNESLWIAFWINLFRHFINYTHIGISNSFNHMFGKRPFDVNISATDNLYVNAWMFGEGNHNYHHTFPQDYKGAEYGDLRHFNLMAFLILVFEALGLAYDLRIAPPEMVARRLARTGDGSYVKQIPSGSHTSENPSSLKMQ